MNFRALVIAALVSLAALPARAEFPLGIYTSNHTTFASVKAMGFRLVIGPHTDTDFREARRLGLKVIPNWFGDDSHSLDRIRALDQDTTIIAWYPFDEPDLYGNSPEVVQTKIAMVRVLSPSKPIFLTAYRPPFYAAYAPFANIFCVTPYPIHGDDPAQNRLSTVHAFTRAARALCRDTPLITAIQCFRQNPWWKRAPTPDELHNMVYQALTGGADGIVHFIYTVGSPDGTIWNLRSRPDLIRRLTTINRQIRAIEPVLDNGHDDDSSLVRIDAGAAVYRLVRHDTGLFLFVANPSNTRTRPLFQLAARPQAARFLHSSKSPTVKVETDGAIRITLPPLACGVIRIAE
jgi:hypothetical protein